MKDLKDLGHGLIELFTSLDSETMAEIFEVYKLEKVLNFNRIEKVDDVDSIDEFISDFSKYSLAFTEARYSAEYSKDTNYEFLKELALSLRTILNRNYILTSTTSPFNEEINEQLNRQLFG